MQISCETIDEYRQARFRVRIKKRDRSKLKREVKRSTLRSLTKHDPPYTFQVRRAYRKLWHEAIAEKDRITLSRRAVNATA